MVHRGKMTKRKSNFPKVEGFEKKCSLKGILKVISMGIEKNDHIK